MSGNKTNRKSPNSDTPKKARTFSFAGEDGYEMLDFLDKEGFTFRYGKSGLIIELLRIYKEAKMVYGDEALFKIRMLIELEKQKSR